jgi:hypothetical protein
MNLSTANSVERPSAYATRLIERWADSGLTMKR